MSYTAQLLIVFILPPLAVVLVCWIASVVNGVRRDIEELEYYEPPDDDRNVWQ